MRDTNLRKTVKDRNTQGTICCVAEIQTQTDTHVRKLRSLLKMKTKVRRDKRRRNKTDPALVHAATNTQVTCHSVCMSECSLSVLFSGPCVHVLSVCACALCLLLSVLPCPPCPNPYASRPGLGRKGKLREKEKA